jgi:peptidoglycan/xylan/chitin deacetylase (PgdA/CDA1 family)
VTGRWVCLLYHDVTPELGGPASGPRRFAVQPRSFEEQLDLIRDCGYRGCSIGDALTTPRERRVAISFDDGDLGQFARAFPALVARGMTATFFVTTSWVGRAGYVAWAQLREMKSAGMSIQSHTRTHPFLSELSGCALWDELAGSKADLDDTLEQSTHMLALPGGDFPPGRLRRLVKESGYSVVATSRWGYNRGAGPGGTEPLYLRRCPVQGAPRRDYMRRVLTGDRWLAGQRRLREAFLGAVRRSLGASRYARWRRQFLDALAQPT